jgi:flagellin
MGFQQGFRINTNTAALNTYRSYGNAQAGLEQNIERLSSGLRINKAADDSAGLSISNRMDNQVRGMQQANRNVQQGNNMLQTAEGALNQIGNMLGRMRELSVQSASDTVSSGDRSSIDLEFEQLKSEINRIAESTEYNGQTLLTGAYNNMDGDNHAATSTYDATKKITIQVGAGNTAAQDQLSLNFGDFVIRDDGTNLDSNSWGGVATGTGTGLVAGVDFEDGDQNGTADDALKLNLSTLGDSQSTIDTLDKMISTVNNARSDIGSKQNRLEFTSSNLMNSIQNNAASMSTIRDADFAAEAADLAKNQILVQSGTSMLAQANGLSQNVLALIR